jgi:hypothetical protein
VTENTIVKESNSRPQPPILPRASERLKDHSLILSKIFSLPNHTIPKRPGRFLTELHPAKRMAVALGLANLWYDNHEDMDFQNTSKVKTEIHKKDRTRQIKKKKTKKKKKKKKNQKNKTLNNFSRDALDIDFCLS